jgi:predicted DCC family thiol-disulfide oxidoreductase YuxK
MKQENTADIDNVGEFLGSTINRTYLLLALCFITATLWLVFAKFVVPPIIESAYRGESFSFVNRMIHGQKVHPVAFYLQLWDGIATHVLVSCLGFWLLAIVTISQAFFRRFVGEATPGTLGAIRMWTCAILLLCTLWEDLSSFALLPSALREPMGLMKILDELPIGYQQFLTSEVGLRVFQWLTELALFLGVIGWRTRVVIPLSAICVFVLNGILREYSFFWHQNLVPIYVLAVLSFTPCGDGWSLDRLLKIYQGRPVPDAERTSAVYGWARYACWVPIALTYAAAGLTKLRADGLFWVSPTSIRHLLYEQTLYPRAGNWSISLFLAPAPDIVFVLLGIVALCGELFFVTVLFSRTARRILPAMQILMHIGIVFLQNIVFFDLMLLLLIFYDFTTARDAIARWLGTAGPLQILYDGSCAICRRTIRLLACLDLFHRLEFQDFRSLDLTEYNRGHALNLKPEHLEKEMYVISRGQAHVGFHGYRTIALALPALWPLAPWLFLPGISTLGEAVYGFIARHRLGHLTCDSSCPTEPSQNSALTGKSPTYSARHRFSYGVAVAGVIVAMGFFWLRAIEYYPFTAVPMFTGKKTSMVTYFKTLGHRESGGISKIYLEDAIGAWSINSRYEILFDLCFGKPADLDLCKKTLSILGSAYNKKVAPGEKLTDLEIQRWKWDFGSDPQDPHYGYLDARFIGPIKANGSR